MLAETVVTGGAVTTAPPPTTVSSGIALLYQTRSITAGQLCEFRRALEVEAAQLAAERRSAGDVAAIAAALDTYLTCDDDAAAQNVHGRAFHHAVARASGNPLLTETMISINEAFAECFALLHTTPDPVPLIHALHWPLLDAIRRGDPTAARTAMLAHFEQLEQVLHERGVNDEPLGVRAASTPKPAPDASDASRQRRAPVAGRG